MSRPTEPLAMEYFRGPHASPGSAAIGLDLDAVVVEIGGLDDALAATLLARYRPYAREGAPENATLRVRLGVTPQEYFIEPPPVPELNPILIACEGRRVRYLGYRVAGWFDARCGRGEMILARGDYEPEERAVENYVRAAVAWQAASAGGALVHAASAVLRDKGYLFFGPSGAGKSTLSSCNTRARVVSDDLSLLWPREGGGLDLVGSPFRGTYTGGEPVQGRFPLAAGFRLVQATQAAVRRVDRVRVFAELVGNLPFVAEAFATRPDLFERVERAFEPIPLAHLLFRKDDSYWDAIEKAGW